MTFQIAGDGQTPSLEYDAVSPQFKGHELAVRKRNWDVLMDEVDRNVLDNFRMELYNVVGLPDFEWLIGSRINDIGILVFEDHGEPCGLKVIIDDEKYFWVLGNRDGLTTILSSTSSVLVNEKFNLDEWLSEPYPQMLISIKEFLDL